MNRNLLVIGTAAAFGVALAVAGVGDASRAVACDDGAKSAAAHSCCSKDKTASAASVGAAEAAGYSVKSAVVAPGRAPILSIAAMGGMVAGAHGDCEWCTPEMCGSAAMAGAHGCPALQAAASGCAEHAGASAVAADVAHGNMVAGHAACEKSAAVAMTADRCTASAAAAHAACAKSTMTARAAGAACSRSAGASAAAAHAGCEKSTATAAAASCCDANAKSAGAEEKCDGVKSASLKGVVDDLPYGENKRVVLAGEYACAHCSLQLTETCAPMFKTAEGKVYPLLQNARASEIKHAKGTNGIQITGVVKKVDGVKYLEVKSYKVL